MHENLKKGVVEQWQKCVSYAENCDNNLVTGMQHCKNNISRPGASNYCWLYKILVAPFTLYMLKSGASTLMYINHESCLDSGQIDCTLEIRILKHEMFINKWSCVPNCTM